MIAAYLLCAIAGVSFMGISAFMGHFGGHGHSGHAGDHGHGGDHGHSAFGLPYLSPVAIAAYVTGFGASGILLTQGLHLTNPLVHVTLAAACAAVFGVVVLLGMAKLTEHAEGNTLASVQDVVGQDVEVSVAIPPGGTGEVSYVAGGSRQQSTARADAGQAFPQGSRVRVTRALDGTLWVTRATATLGQPATLGEPVAPPRQEKIR